MSANIVLQAVVEKTNLSPNEVGDIVVGTVLAPGSLRAMECRMAAFYAGFPGIYFLPFLLFCMKFYKIIYKEEYQATYGVFCCHNTHN